MKALIKSLGLYKKREQFKDGGQLMCVVCKIIVKSETIWPIHLNSKSHKETLSLTRKSLEEKDKKNNVSFKRPCSPLNQLNSKKVKGILKNPGHSSTSTLPSNFFDNPSGQSSSSVVPITSGPSKTDLHSQNNNKNVREAEQVKEAESNASATLPEGFFDDPIQDAKVRNVEYKDPLEEEWEKYKKAIKEETAQSAQIIADDQEEANTEREMEEVEEQIHNYQRVVQMDRQKLEFQRSKKQTNNIDVDSSSDDDNDDYDEFIDWRAKSSNIKK
ncbi:hypothetical protein HCN44_000752 [Aphidius gifuensis]|uniref:Zinc finger protein 830 n=1 Tax=Aphidius gifuensis TaxID=684658 RepID=A0A835CP56_APHGI|nr:hypothetical protein HCN44_000752 [Aphidius gifuensis]